MPKLSTTHVTIHTDGACSGNPGPGGWSAIVRWWKDTTIMLEEELSGGDATTTNNQMELAAAIAGVQRVVADNPALSLPINLYCDSEYVTLNARDRLPRWRLNGWKTSDKKPVKNKALWLALDGICSGRSIVYRWVKAHNGDPMNERADSLAKDALAQFKPNEAA